MGSITKADRDSMISAALRKWQKEEMRMIVRIDAFQNDVENKKKKSDNRRKARKGRK